jgi:CheY-like chemotaxis protein
MKTILLVDDDPVVLRTTGTVLQELGYRVLQRHDAFAALALLREGIQIDLVVTDYQMPEMNGTELAAELRRTMPDMPVIMLTAYGDVATYLTCLSYGVFDCLHKPVKGKDLKRIITAALGGLQQHPHPE